MREGLSFRTFVTMVAVVTTSIVGFGAEPVPAQTPAATFELIRVDVTGTKRYSPHDIVRLSGLTVGQRVSAGDVRTAAEKLSATGLLAAIRYRTETTGEQIVVTFAVEDATWDTPVVYDNFVWFTKAELDGAVAAELPSYDGTAPASNQVAESITRVLRRELASRGIPGDVVYQASQGLDGSERKYVFSVRNPAVSLCALRFEGASSIFERQLASTSQRFIGSDYSQSRLENHAALTLIQPYREKGYWKATFSPPMPALSRSGGCEGVTVVLRVTEGVPYRWDRAEWVGNTAMSSAELDRLLGFKPGDVANGIQLEDALIDVKDAYEKVGYVTEKHVVERVLDDATYRAAFRIRVTEGPRFHMGIFKVVGLAAKDADDLAKLWRLKPGDVYDGSYVSDFQRTALRGYGTALGTVTPTIAADANHVVNVTFAFTRPNP